MSKNIYQKLIELRKEFHELKLNKSGKNRFANYDYFELKDFVPQAVVLSEKHGLTPIFDIGQEMAALTVVNVEVPEEKIVFSTPVADASGKGQLPIQSLGSQHTYLRRYLYMNFLDIVESDGIDALSDDKKDTTKKPTEKLAIKQQIKSIQELYSVADIEKMLSRLGYQKIEEITFKQADTMIQAKS